MEIDILNREVKKVRESLFEWRRYIHEYPELELDCDKTADLVSQHIESLGLNVKTGIAKTGVVGVLRGRKAKPVVALRVDMDGLPIQEQTNLSFASKVDGVMHACGHDGHTAIGMGVAAVLSAVQDSLEGTVKFIFQPGEEDPGASKIMIAEGVLEDPKVDAIFGCHIYPGIPSGEVGVRYGTMCAACDEFDILVKGVGGHGAYPHQCRDSIVAAANLINGIQTIVSRMRNPVIPLVISICKIEGGAGYNLIPDRVTLGGTIRSIDEESRDKAHEHLKRIFKGIETGYCVGIEFEMLRSIPPLKCDKRLVAFVEERLVEILGSEKVRRISEPSLGAEDFAYYSERIPSAYVRLGCYDEKKGFIHGLHTPYFDFDENLLVEATRELSFLLMKFLSADLAL